MEIKIFGKTLFEFKGKKSLYYELTTNEAKTSKYLPDFHQNQTNASDEMSDYIAMGTVSGGAVAVPKWKKAKPVAKVEEKKITPKGVHELKLLHDQTFKLNTSPEYVDGQLADFKDKLGLIKAEEFDMRNGVKELSSIVTRLENRKKYADFKDFFEQFPYTTTSKINGVVKLHDNLKLGQVAQFIADMPKEAITIMKDYNKNTDKLCGKQAVFYIIADKKDFKKSDQRRDPILLAQSPFGHFWQILGAWDEEMMFIEEL